MVPDQPPNGESLEQLRGIADAIKRALPGVGFALFLSVPGRVDYLSNADRADVVVALADWLKRRPGTGRAQSSHEIDERLVLERRCAELARTILTTPHVDVALFAFDFGPANHGNLAYFVSEPRMRHVVAEWVHKMKNHGQA